MFGKIISFFTKSRKYYVKIKVDGVEYSLSSFSDLISLLDGQPNEVPVCNVTGHVQVIIGEK